MIFRNDPIRLAVRMLIACEFTVISLSDLKTRRIPADYLRACLMTFLYAACTDGKGFRYHLYGMILTGLPLFVLWHLTDGKKMGGGDVKLMAAAGLLLGPAYGLYALLTACCLALICNLGEENGHFAMGPYFCVSIFCWMLFT